MNSNEILDREFLEIRAKILEVAAALDRIDRAEGEVAKDSKHSDPIRAEKIQLLFSREYDQKWLDEFALASRT
jgi:hypothetical protein